MIKLEHPGKGDTMCWLRSETARNAALFQQGLKLYLTDDFQEGARAFLEERPPEFKGR